MDAPTTANNSTTTATPSSSSQADTTTNQLLLTGCHALVTGASSGIGQATCRILTRYGARVIGTGRNEAQLRALRDDDDNNRILHDFVVADLTQEGECQRVVERAVQRLNGTLTTVVNAAGVLQGGAVGSIDLDNYHFNMRVNTQAPLEIMMHAIPYLKENSQTNNKNNPSVFCNSSIVNISSVNGKQSFAGVATYCMSKAALDSLTRCASLDLAPDGIRVNAVNPGVIVPTKLQLSGGLTPQAYEAFLQRSISTTHPLAASLGRVGTPDEVAELVAFLVSNKAQFLTGECIALDGGRQNLGAR